MVIRLRDPINQKPVFFVSNMPEISTEICCKYPIGSKELQTLLRVSLQLRDIVYYIYNKNVQDILKCYANNDTPFNRIISTQPDVNPLTIETTSTIQQSIIQLIKNLGVPCPNKHLGLEDIPRFNQAIEDLNLQKIWVPISRALAVEEKPAENASAQEIRLWMNENNNHLQNIVRLDLSRKALTTIPREITLLTKLQVLSLHNNQITVLPQGIFDALNQLQWLNLSDNQITVLPQGIFAGLNQLQGLNLSYNQITVLPQGIFDPLIQLQALGLGTNRITVLPQGIFDPLIQLQKLGLGTNRITVLPQGIFDGLNHLQLLSLNNNQITVLPKSIFAGLNQLQGLQLQNNQITVLPKGIFDPLIQLQKLRLGNNRITVLPQGIFDPLIQLQLLGLNNNRITVLPQGIFDGLNQLQHLFLQNNQITFLPQGIFDPLIQLQLLGLHHNQITVLLQGIFDQLNQLRKLGLHHNQINALPQGIFAGLNQLEELYLYGNPRLLFSYQDTQTPVLIDPDPALNNDLKAFKEFNTYVCKSSFAQFYQFVAQGNTFNDVMIYFLHLSPYLQNVINLKVREELDNSPYQERFPIALKKAVRWIFEMSTDQLKNIIYTQLLQLAKEFDAVKREQIPGLPPEDFTDPNWGRDHAQDNILMLIDAMSLSANGFLG